MNRIFRNVSRITLPLLFSFSAVANTDSQPLTVKDDAPKLTLWLKVTRCGIFRRCIWIALGCGLVYGR